MNSLERKVVRYLLRRLTLDDALIDVESCEISDVHQVHFHGYPVMVNGIVINSTLGHILAREDRLEPGFVNEKPMGDKHRICIGFILPVTEKDRLLLEDDIECYEDDMPGAVI